VDAHTYYRVFLEDSSGRALIDHRGPFVGDEQQQIGIIDAMVAGRKVFLISAPPGCGKSRFALELARRLGGVQRSWDVRFARHDETALRQELPELKARHLVLIVDDAQDCPSVVELLAATAHGAQSEQSIHLICLTRPAGRATVAEALANHFPVGEPQELELGRPNAKLVRELIDKLIPQLSPHHRDVIRRIVADSFFSTVLLCTRVARQKNLPQTLSTRNLREFTVRQPVAQAARDLTSTDKALAALAVYAACAPVRAGDATLRASAATISGVPLAEIEVLEQRVQEAGLFQADARGALRPVPDLVGDLILEETCLNEQGRPTPLGQALMRTLFDGYHESITRNCADIARLFSTSTRVDLLSELALERAEGLTAGMHAEALQLLDGCSSLATRQPDTVVRLVEVLTEKGILRAEPPARELNHPDNLEVHAQSLLTLASEHDPTVVPRAMEYSRHLVACARKEARSYQALRENLTAPCQFGVARPLAHAQAVLDVLSAWADAPDVETVELAAALVNGFLQLEMRTQRWEQDALTPVLVSLAPTQEIWKLRDRALDILVRCSRHSAPAVQFAAADSIRQWAHGYRNVADELRERWVPQLNRELDTLLDSFSKLGSTTTHLPVRAAIEHQGWRWWSGDLKSLAQRGARKILETLPEAKPYSLWKALHDEALPVFPIPLEETTLSAPSAERTPQLAKELFDQLDPTCADTAAWSALFTSVLSALPRRHLQQRAPVYIAEFVRRHSDAAWSFVTEESAHGILGVILPALLVELRRHDSLRWQEAIQKSLPGTRLFELELRALCAANELDGAEQAMVSKALGMDDTSVVHLSAQALLNAAPSALAPGLTAVFAVLPTRPVDERLWELTLDAFSRWGSHVLSAPEGEETGPEMRALSGELLKLLRSHGSSLSWQQGPHTRKLATVVAIFAVAVPHTLKSWMRELWSTGGAADDELPLSTARFTEVVRLTAQSPTATFWQKQFIEWMTHEPDLAPLGARGLLAMRGLQPDSPQFVAEATTLLSQFTDSAEAYAVLESQINAEERRFTAQP
jgi:DNA polymerase III delta prime subunit